MNKLAVVTKVLPSLPVLLTESQKHIKTVKVCSFLSDTHTQTDTKQFNTHIDNTQSAMDGSVALLFATALVLISMSSASTGWYSFSPLFFCCYHICSDQCYKSDSVPV